MTIAIVTRGVSTVPPVPPPPPVSSGLPPVLEQAANAVGREQCADNHGDAPTLARFDSPLRCGPERNFMGSPSRMKRDTAGSVGQWLLLM